MLDVWYGQESALRAALESKQVEFGGNLGLIEQQGWYTPETILKKYPEFATYRGLLNSNMTESG